MARPLVKPEARAGALLAALLGLACSRAPDPPKWPGMRETVALPLASPPSAEPVVITAPSGENFTLGLPSKGRYIVHWEISLRRERPLPSSQRQGDFDSVARPPHTFSLYLGDELRLSITQSEAVGTWRFLVRPRELTAYWVYPNEEAWIVGATSRDIAEMILYAPDHAVPGEKALAFSLAEAPEAGPAGPSYLVSLSAGAGAAVRVTLAFPEHIWAPDRYEPLAAELLRVLGLKASAGPSGGEILDRLKDPLSPVLERESQRVSRRLEEAMLDPGAHEEAAIILGAFALREAAGGFSDTRQTLCRMAAHLAVAHALRHGASSPFGDYGEAVLLTLVNRERDALRRVAALEKAGPPDGGVAWQHALRLRNTRDWRILKRPGAASLLERLEHYRAVKASVGSAAALEFVESFKAEPTSDWARVAFAPTSVEVGNVFGPSMVDMELKNAAETWQAYHGGVASGDMTVALDARPGGLLVRDEAGKATPRVIDWGAWARFFERNLLFEVDARASFLAQQLGSPDEARRLRMSVIERFSRLDLLPLLMARWAISEEGKRPCLEGDDQARQTIRHESCVKSVALMQQRPELLTPEVWLEAGTTCTLESMRQSLTPRWFKDVVPAGTALFDQGREMLVLPPERNLLEISGALHAVAPYDPFILAVMDLRADPSFAARAERYGPLAEYNIGLMLGLARTALDDPAKALPLYNRVCAINPDSYLELGDYLADLGREREAAAAFAKGIETARDRVGASNDAFWVVGYYCDHGPVKEAARIAEMAADVYSSSGLSTMGYFMERMARYDEAVAWYGKIVERYNETWPLDAFYIRYQHRVGDDRFRTETAAALKRAFPQGLQRVSLAGLKPPPPRGPTDVVVTGRSHASTGFGLVKDDLVIALNGYRVRSDEQYQCLWTLDDDPQATVIVWRGNQFLEVKGRMPRNRYAPVDPPFRILKKPAPDVRTGA